MNSNNNIYFTQLADKIKQLGKDFGFADVKITDAQLLPSTISNLQTWIDSNMHADMHYFVKRLATYQDPSLFMPNVTKIICCTLNYPPIQGSNPIAAFAQLQDYTSFMKQLLITYAQNIRDKFKILQNFKVSAGNAPVLEKALAAKSGLGWYGKNSLLITKDVGSYCFLGTVFTDINVPLPNDKPLTNNCGNCQLCITDCPTRAIVAPYTIDARRCISYLTIEHRGSIPRELRPLLGTKIFGCDVCQTVCPWNKKIALINNLFSVNNNFKDFKLRDLCNWFLWNEEEFHKKTYDLPIKRLGYERWLRNIAVALGNLPKNQQITEMLQARLQYPSLLVREHVAWALEQHNDGGGIKSDNNEIGNNDGLG